MGSLKPDYDETSGKVYAQNMLRLFYAPIIIIPLALGHILIFSLKLPEAGTIEFFWRHGIIISHSFLLLVTIILGTFAYSFRKKGIPGVKFGNIVIRIFYLLLIFLGVAVVVIDQLVVSSIIPFLIIYAVLAIVLLVEPKYAIAFFVAGYIAFFFALPITQVDPDILLSNRVNGLTTLGIGIFLSYILWRNTIEKFRQELVIKKQSEDLQKQNIELKKAISTRDRLFSIIGHDLRNPLSAIVGLNEIVLQSIEEKDFEKGLRLSDAIKGASGQTMALLDNLLEWSKSQSKDKGLELQTISAKKLVDETLDMVFAFASQKSIKLASKVNCDTLVCDVNMIKTILRNLLSNAIKYSHQGGLVKIIVDQEEGLCKFYVIDEGVGMEKSKVNKLFTQAVVSTTRGTMDEKGTGLGLLICKELVALHQGTIGVESEVGKGTIFHFAIPNNLIQI